MKIFNVEWLNKEMRHIRSTISKVYVYANDEKIEGDLTSTIDENGLLHVYGVWDNPDFNARTLSIQGVEVWDIDSVCILYDNSERSDKVQGMSFYYELPITLTEKENSDA